MSRTRFVLLAAAFVPAFIILAVTSVLWLVLENADRVWAKHGKSPDKWSAVVYGTAQHMDEVV